MPSLAPVMTAKRPSRRKEGSSCGFGLIEFISFYGIGQTGWVSGLKRLRDNGKTFLGHGFTGCGKIPKVSFRGRGLPEESAFFLGLAKKQIPRFARDDIKLHFSAASSTVP
jgi:hypothetical protein